MSGLKSRRKGMTAEYEVRDYFRSLGYEAHRVPASGASQGFKGDIKVYGKDFPPFLVEVKRRKASFGAVYKLLDNNWTDVVGYHHKSYSIAQSWTAISNVSRYLLISEPVVKSVLNLKRHLGEAQYLAVRDDHKPWVFIKFNE